jgi:uncharacterized protein GlcG (DUF336 family)
MSRDTVSIGSAAKVVGEVDLVNFYNDGNKGTGNAQEMALAERTTLAFEGVVVVALDIYRLGGVGISGAGVGSQHEACGQTLGNY